MAEATASVRRFWDSDLIVRLRGSPAATVAVAIVAAFVLASVMAPWIAPQNPYDLAALDIANAMKPPVFAGGSWQFPLGADSQGRDILSAILFGCRTSIAIGAAAVALALAVGLALGLISGYAGGFVDAVIMRIADIQLAFPAILVALLIDGLARGFMGREHHERLAMAVLVVSISLSLWVQFARTARGSTLVEKEKDYVRAARVMGQRAVPIMARHLLPNVIGPVLVIATINFVVAIITEATLSFLGVGLPATVPSLGTLIRAGNDFMFSGQWWILLFPALALSVLVVAVNTAGDWLREALNPKLR
ncbi:MAG: ABC transporter permease [Rhodospirillaceae bacterium]|nr:ABC transporter permease [Rhodospirillaceae bacterium]